MTEPTVVYSVRELIERIDERVEVLERSAARQVTVRWSVVHRRRWSANRRATRGFLANRYRR